jgi:hypothetical protein
MQVVAIKAVLTHSGLLEKGRIECPPTAFSLFPHRVSASVIYALAKNIDS